MDKNVRRYSPIKLSSNVKAITMPNLRYPSEFKYLRADSKPNWNQRVRTKEGEAGLISSKPPITINQNSIILDALEKITKHNIRGIIVTDEKERLRGIVMATDLVNYLGGGEYYRIIEQRHKGNIYSAMNEEKISSIMNPMPIFVRKSQKLLEIIKIMESNGLGMLPVLDKNKIIGVITEHDIVKHLIYENNKNLGKTVKEIMTRNIVASYENDTLKRVAQLMSLYGFRRIPIISYQNNEIIGIVSAKDFVSYFGSHRVFKEAISSNIEEILKLPLTEIMRKEVFTITGDEDIAKAAEDMIDNGVNSLIVINDNKEAIGIITERDVLMALLME